MSAPESVAARPVRQPFCFTASDRLPPRISFSPSATPLLSSSASTLSGLLTMACASADNFGCQSAGGSISIYLCNSLKKSAPAWAMVVARPARSVLILGCPAGASTVIARCSARAVSMSGLHQHPNNHPGGWGADGDYFAVVVARRLRRIPG